MNPNTVAKRHSAGSFGNWTKMLWNWWEAYTRRRGYRMAATHLRSLSESQLKDIGLSRGEIEFAVRHGRKPARGELAN